MLRYAATIKDIRNKKAAKTYSIMEFFFVLMICKSLWLSFAFVYFLVCHMVHQMSSTHTDLRTSFIYSRVTLLSEDKKKSFGHVLF